MKKMKHAILLASLCLLLASSSSAQGILAGDDPLGRPYRPVYGTIAPLIAKDVPEELGQELATRFYACLGEANYAGQRPYTIVDKTKLEKLDNMIGHGMTKEQLRKNYYWALLGSQALIRIEINAYNKYNVVDSVFQKGTHTLSKVLNYEVIDVNMSARFTDVTTSKILKYDNFTISVDSKNYSPITKLTVEEYLKKQIIDALCQKGQQVFTGMLSGSPVIDSVFQVDGSKAKVVLVNDAPLTAYCKKGTNFFAYGIEKMYTVGDQQFPHVTNIGQIEKASDYTYKLAKYEVITGKKEMLEQMQKGTTIVCNTKRFPLPAFKPSITRTGVICEEFTDGINAGLSIEKPKILRDVFLDVIASHPLLIDALDREIYDMVEKEKRVQMRTKSDATQGGIEIGSELLLTGVITDYRTDSKINYFQPPAPKTPQPSTDAKKGETKPEQKNQQKTTPPSTAKENKTKLPESVTYSMHLTLNLKATSIKTGEDVFAKAYKIDGAANVPYYFSGGKTFNVDLANQLAFQNAAENFTKLIWSDIFYHITPKLYLLDIAELKKDEAESVIIGGGSQAGFLPGTPLDVVEVTYEEVQGSKLERETVIGRLRMKDVREATTICKVRDGGKAIAAKMNDEAKLYVRLGYEKQ